MATTAPTSFAVLEQRLREILQPYRKTLVATKDGPDGLVLEIPGLEGKPWGYVAGVRTGKRYVSYHLMRRPRQQTAASPRSANDSRRRSSGDITLSDK